MTFHWALFTCSACKLTHWAASDKLKPASIATATTHTCLSNKQYTTRAGALLHIRGQVEPRVEEVRDVVDVVDAADVVVFVAFSLQ